MYRTEAFFNGVNCDQLLRFKYLVLDGRVPSLEEIRKLSMPQFSGVSFISKILAFLDPERHCVLDLRLGRLRDPNGIKAIDRLVIGNQIRVTDRNSKAYIDWCSECSEISGKYLKNNYRTVDIERGFFQMIGSGCIDLARKIYKHA